LCISSKREKGYQEEKQQFFHFRTFIKEFMSQSSLFFLLYAKKEARFLYYIDKKLYCSTTSLLLHHFVTILKSFD
jgi:hypothetical protein